MADLIKGAEIYELCEKLFPICRSITGDGVRKTLRIIDDYIADKGLHLNLHEVPTGTQVYDWTIPKEWKIREAYIEDENGTHIIDFKNNNLYVMSYSTPINKWVDLDELNKHIYTQMDQPDVIPYVTSYYARNYGFCMSETQRRSLTPGRYHMVIDSELFDGSLTYADLLIYGKTEKEVLITSYICHPSMANNECSGPSLLAELIKYVVSIEDRKYTYRFVLGPESIGAIAYISKNYDALKKNVVAGFNLSCVGDNGPFSMIKTPSENTLPDRILLAALQGKELVDVYSFMERGSDERQYNTPRVNIPMVCFCRSKFGLYKEYHTSADDMDFVSPKGFQGSYEAMCDVIKIIENNERYMTTVMCEPQLGKRGLNTNISQKGMYGDGLLLRHFLAFADGKNDLIDIARILHKPVKELLGVTQELLKCNLIDIVSEER